MSVAKLQKNHLMMQEFDSFMSRTDDTHAKIEESIMTLLYVVKKESDLLFRKKEQISDKE